MWSLTALFSIMLTVSSIAALPVTQSCLSQYAVTKHLVPLYRTTNPALAHLEANITIGSQSVLAIMDTGSSDIWFKAQDFECIAANKTPIAQNLCGFHGPQLAPNSEFHPIPDLHLNITYASGGLYLGEEVYSSVSFGGFNVSRQQVSLVEIQEQSGYAGLASGIVGLAYPGLTNVYAGNLNDSKPGVRCVPYNGTYPSNCTSELYSPLLSTIFADSLAPPVFSFAISRSNSTGGIMSIGGLPDVTSPQINITKDAAQTTVPLEMEPGRNVFLHYAISVDGFEYVGAPTNQTKTQYIVDTGTVSTNIDKDNAARVNALFDPPAMFVKEAGAYYVQCNATAPDFAVNIGGTTFDFSPEDLKLVTEEGGQFCLSGVQPTTPGQYILGSVFLSNALAVFDVGNAQMTFASRRYYQG